jgi:hypothetical protein
VVKCYLRATCLEVLSFISRVSLQEGLYSPCLMQIGKNATFKQNFYFSFIKYADAEFPKNIFILLPKDLKLT